MKKMLSENKNLLMFNISRTSSITAFIPFEIYAMYFFSVSPSGRYIFGIIMIVSVIIGMVSSPLYGNIIDLIPRKLIIKKILLSWIFVSIPLSLIWKFFKFPPIIYIVPFMLFIGVTDELLWRSLIALQQNIASYKNYGKSNGIAEISGQLPTIIGPAISIPVLLYLGAYFSLLVGSLMCIIPLYFISRINENFIPESFKPRDKKGTFNMAKKYPYEIIFIFLLNFPYIMISVGNFLKPVFIVTVIHGNASSIAISEMVYAVFASFTGMILTFTLKKHEILLAYSFFSMYIIGSLLMPFSGIFMIYLICQGIHGIGNPGTRISRNTFVMKHVENKYSGRFNSALSLFTNASRLLLLIIFTTFINILGSKELLFLSAIMLIIIISLSILITRKPEVKNFINGKSIIKL